MKPLLYCFLLVFLLATSTPTLHSNVPNVPIVGDEPKLETVVSGDEYAKAIEYYLSTGGDPMQLHRTLLQRDMIPNFYHSPLLSTVGVYVADLTGDGNEDVVVNLYYPMVDDVVIRMFVIWIYVWDSGTYRQAFSDGYPAFSQVSDFGLYVGYVEDLNNDGSSEVVYQSGGCGANTCGLRLHVVMWDSELELMRQIFNRYFEVGAGATYWLDNSSSPMELIIHEVFMGPVTRGIMLDQIVTYSWDETGTKIIPINVAYQPPRFAFRVVYEAVAALDEGDTSMATTLFEGVLTSPAFVTPDPALRAQALFGILVATTAQDGVEAAADAYAALLNEPLWIDQRNSELSHEILWVEVGRLFYQTVQVTGDLSAACQNVIVIMNAERYGEREQEYWNAQYGGGNASPNPEDMCPF
jgi:hypothetical protein